MKTEEKKEYEHQVGKNQLTDGSVLDCLPLLYLVIHLCRIFFLRISFMVLWNIGPIFAVIKKQNEI